jgi:hypothetical protein
MPASHDLWIKLHSDYYIAPDASFPSLLQDASDLLHGARGIVRCLGDALACPDVETVDTDDLSCALMGIATLIDMGHRCMAKAHLRMMLMAPNA